MPDSTPAYRGLRIAFAGTPDFAAVHLEALLSAGADIIAVYTQPDRPAGRGKKLTPSPVKNVAGAHHLPLLQPASLRDSAVQAEFAALEADVLVVVAYGLIIPQFILDTPSHGCINVHASLLPRWRGAAPIQRAIEAGDLETGITIMQMDAGLDTGAMLHKVALPIHCDDTGGSLHDRLAAIGPSALLQTLSALALGTCISETQDDSQSCYAHKISKEEARINWADDAEVIARKVRAFNPFPVCFTPFNGSTLRIWTARAAAGPERGAPGLVASVAHDGIEVVCGKGSLLISRVQLPGKKPMSVAEVVRGNPELFTEGVRFGGPQP